jgi:hypothetical protein
MSKHFAKLIAAVAAALAAMALIGPAAQADTPNKGYEAFAGCPSNPGESSEVSTCIRTVIDGGHFQMGNKDVPITKTMVLSGGVNPELKNFVYNSKGGLTPVKQQVPGGVIGLTGLDWLVNFLSIDALQLYAVTELAGTPDLSNPESPTLPIKVHLINPVLGNKCYVGSNSNPIKLNLTIGTTSPPPPNEPITGEGPTDIVYDFETEIYRAKNGIYVDNSFAAPGASGCTLTLFGFIPLSINGLINTASGLPAPAGTNETVQNFDLEITSEARAYP